MEITGITKKFAIDGIDCYLKIGIENEKPVCIDLTISKTEPWEK